MPNLSSLVMIVLLWFLAWSLSLFREATNPHETFKSFYGSDGKMITIKLTGKASKVN